LIEKAVFLEKTMRSDAYHAVKVAVVNQLRNENFIAKKQLLQWALDTENVQVRQAVASALSTIPEEFRVEYETLLDDKSYQTQEIALYRLWNNFPKFRSVYLEKSKDWIGLNDFNLKTLWLSLAIATPDYAADKEGFIVELITYSSPNYEAITRENALEKLIAFHFINDTVLKNLVNATTHHMWQFSKYGRDTIRGLIKDPEMKAALERIVPELNEKEQFQLNRLLRE
jgi:aminopeptidase N